MKKYLKKTLTIFLRVIASFLVLFVFLVLLIQIPSVQNFIKNKTVTYIEGKIKTKVKIDSLKIGFPEKIILQGVYFEDQKKDTLLAGRKMAVDISIFQLIHHKIEINSLELEGISSHLNRNQKGVFNFDYIIKAFAAEEKPKKDDTTPLQFSLNEIKLNEIKISFKDAKQKSDFFIGLNHFDTQIEAFNLEEMDFQIPKVTINGLQLKLKQGLVENLTPIETKPSKNSHTTHLKIKLGEIDFRKFNIDYLDENSKEHAGLTMKKLAVKFDKIDIEKQFILIKSIDLSDTKGIFAIAKKQKAVAVSKENIDQSNSDWEVKINASDFKRIDLNYDDNTILALKKGIDYNHLNLKNLNLAAENINYNPENISGNINSFRVKEQSGLVIESFSTDFFYGKKNAYLKKLQLKTPQTEWKDEILIGYPSIESITKNLGELSIKASVKKSKLGFKDILLFVPTLSETDPFKNNPNAILHLNGAISGKLKNIEIPNLEISGIGTTKLAASGQIIGLPDMKKAHFDLAIHHFSSNSKDINSFVPKGSIPSSVQLPSQFNAKGTFKGTMDYFNTNMNLQSSFGNAKIKAMFDQRIKNKEKYNAQAILDNFNLGAFIKNDSVGKLTLKATIKGIGLNPKTAQATGNATLVKADFKKYVYQNIIANGKISSGKFNLEANAKDPNLTFDLVSSGSFRDKYPSGKVNLNVDIADLKKLNLHAGAMKLKGNIDADLQTIDLDYLNGSINAHTLTVTNAKEQYTLDSVSLIATSNSEKNTIQIQSPLLNASLNGKYKLSQIGNALSNSIAKYYDSNPKSKKIATQKQQFEFKIDLKHHPLIMEFVPELKSFEPIAIVGNYNSDKDSLTIKGLVPKLKFADYTITNAILDINTKDKILSYNFVVDDIQSPQIQLPYTAIFGKIEHNTIDYALQLKDLNNKERYYLAGTLKSINENSEIHLDPNALLLNYDSWNMSSDNLIRFGKKGIYISDFEIEKEGNSIKIASQSENENAPIAVDFKDFEIETLSKMVEKSELQMGGKINGNALLKNVRTKPFFTSDLMIENFSIKKDTIGTINIKINNEIADTYDTKIAITNQGNQATLDGIYKSNDSSFDLNLNIEKLNMKSIQGFSMGEITESTGFLTGNFKISGNTNQPNILGTLQFNEVGFKAKQLNSKFKSINDKIQFTTDAIYFDRFVIKDEKDNELIVNGKIDKTNFSNFGFDLTIDATNFKAINSQAKDNDLYYGELFLDNHLKVTGTLDNPTVEGNIKINKDTQFTIVLPQSDPSIADREGIVEFIDQDNPQLIETVITDEINSKTDVKGINASVNIEVDKEASLTIIIDKTNGDNLQLKGAAQLNGGIDPSGKTTLTGKYEFSEGAYEMTFSSIKRKFDIKKGSYILWTGEPTMADINITAVYKIKAAPIDLLDNQLGGVTTEERNTYKEKIPFEAELNMNGELMKPDISFDIILPEENNNSVSSKILNETKSKLAQLRQQTDELNKQVFALIVLGRFIGENPFASESGGTSASSIARESASKILSQQLNNLAGDLISGVELNFDLQTIDDYSSGQKENKTDLNIGVTKKLLNDRLKVTVGSSFGLEGSQQANEQASNIGGDISLDYQLSKDGKYKIRAYRVNKYQVALQGEVVETGIAFIITLDYDKFRELFHKNKTRKAKTKKEKVIKTKSDE